MKLEQLKHAKKILVYGLGKEGASTLRFLQSLRIKPAIVTKYEDGGKTKKPIFSKFDIIIMSPGVGREMVPKKLANRVTSNTEIFFANLDEAHRQRVIGITGTKGKSTTATFCYELLKSDGFKVALAGNIGQPLLDFFKSFQRGNVEFIVAELSSYQLENLKISPGIGIMLNIFPDHLHRHQTMAKYLEAKSHLWKYQNKNDVLIIPSEWARVILKKHPAKSRVVFSKKISNTVFPKDSVFRADHLLQNFGTAAALANELGISRTAVVKAAKKFKPLPHRLQLFAIKKGIHFYDDSIAVNPGSAFASASFFKRKLGSIILGGQNRKQDFKALLKYLVSQNVFIIVLKSETGERVVRALKKLNYKKIVEANTLTEAVEIAFRNTPRSQACLLSPAAPSYDRFKNFEEKGSAFQEAVKKYKSK